MSEHENAFDQFVSIIQEDLLIHKKVFYLNHLLEKGVSMIKVDFGPISETVYIDIISNTIIER